MLPIRGTLLIATVVGAVRVSASVAKGLDSLELIRRSVINDAEEERDCSPRDHRDRIQCEIVPISCEDANREESAHFATSPFDLRVDDYAKVDPRNNRIDYTHNTEIQFEPPHDESLIHLRGFYMTIEDARTGVKQCLLFNLTLARWDLAVDRRQPPRFQYSTTTRFDFGSEYTVRVSSMPGPPAALNSTQPNSISRRISTVEHPNGTSLFLKAICMACWKRSLGCCSNETARGDDDDDLADVDCTTYSNPAAIRWVAAFYSIKPNPYPRTLFVEFVAAPKQYCFEDYELVLLISYRHVQRVNIPKEQLYMKVVGNDSALMGNHTFTDVDPGIYDVGVVADAWSRNSSPKRCLCQKKPDIDPTLTGQQCRCTMTQWRSVVMGDDQPPLPPNPCESDRPPPHCPPPMRNNSTVEPPAKIRHHWPVSLVLLATLAVAVFVLSALLLAFLCSRYAKRGPKAVRVRFVALENGHAKKDYDDDSKATELIALTPADSKIFAGAGAALSVLVVYAHDSKEHDAAVAALATLLRSSSIDVRLDAWELEAVARQRLDWARAAVAAADRVLLVNSAGAHRRRAAQLRAEPRVERREPHALDDLFLLQLDAIAVEIHRRPQEAERKFLACHLSYTPECYLMEHISPYVRFNIPRNLDALLDRLRPPSPRPRAQPISQSEEYGKLLDCIDAARAYYSATPYWFERSHVAEPCAAIPTIPLTAVGGNPVEVARRPPPPPVVDHGIAASSCNSAEDEGYPSDHSLASAAPDRCADELAEPLLEAPSKDAAAEESSSFQSDRSSGSELSLRSAGKLDHRPNPEDSGIIADAGRRLAEVC